MQPQSSEGSAKGAPALAGQKRAFSLPRLSFRSARQLHVQVTPAGLYLTLLGSGKNAKPVAKLSHPFEDSDIDLVTALQSLPASLAMLQAELAKTKAGDLRDSQVAVTIDDGWMLYDIVRASVLSLPPQAADAVVNASLADVSGCEPGQLISRWQPQRSPEHTIACSIPSGVMPLLEQVFKERGISVTSVQGDFVRAFNAQRSKIDPACSVIARIRHGSTQLSVVVNGSLIASSYEFGVTALADLEQRGRSLLRGAGIGADKAVRFYALTTKETVVTTPWILLATSGHDAQEAL